MPGYYDPARMHGVVSWLPHQSVVGKFRFPQGRCLCHRRDAKARLCKLKLYHYPSVGSVLNNPSCSVSFLEDGRLFRLESDPAFRSKSNRVEYFWLCHHCSSTMALHLREDGTLVTACSRLMRNLGVCCALSR